MLLHSHKYCSCFAMANPHRVLLRVNEGHLRSARAKRHRASLHLSKRA